MRNSFITGLVIFLPLIITYKIITFILGIITRPFEQFVRALLNRLGVFSDGAWLLSHEQVIALLSDICILFALVTFVILIGIMGRWVVMQSLMYFSESLLRKIPIINKVYGTCKDLVSSLFAEKSGAFSKVVLVPYPSVDQLGIGLVTGEFLNTARPELGEIFVSVLIPCTPNPTVGFLCSFPKNSVTFLDLPVDETLKYLMSCGSALPVTGFKIAEEKR